VRRQLLDGIYAGQPFRPVLRDLGLTSNQVFGLAKTDEEWSTTLEAALTASRRSDLKHGTNAAYVAGCVCKECRAYHRASGWVGGATDGQPTLTRLYRAAPRSP
jgi:hypothetical protein